VLYLTGYRQRAFYGRDYKLKQEISIADLMERVNTVVARETAVIREQLGRNGVTMIDGTARFRIRILCRLKGNKPRSSWRQTSS